MKYKQSLVSTNTLNKSFATAYKPTEINVVCTLTAANLGISQ